MIRVSVPKLDLLYWLLAVARAPLPLDLLNVLEKLEAKHWLLKAAGAFSGRERESWLTPCPCVSLMDVTHGNAFSLVLVWCVPRYSSSGLCQAADGTSAADVVSAGCVAMSNQKKRFAAHDYVGSCVRGWRSCPLQSQTIVFRYLLVL